VLGAVEKPLVRHRANRAQDGKLRGEHRLVDPRGEDAVKNRLGEVGLFHADRLVVGLMIEAAGGVVVARRIAGRDVVRQVQAASNLVQDLSLELGVTGRWLLRLDLPEPPAIRQHCGHALLEFDHVHRLEGLGLAVGRGVGEQHGREVGGRLGGGDHRQRVPSQLGEQRQRGRDLGDAAMLTGPVGAEPVHHRVGRHQVILRLPRGQVAGVLTQDGVGLRVAPGVEDDAIDVGVRRQHRHDRRCHAVGLDQMHIQHHRRIDGRVGGQNGEGLTVGALGQPHRAEFLGQVDRLGPPGERLLDAVVRVAVLGEQLQTRTGADAVVGDGQDDPLGVGVVRHLVAAALAEFAADVGRGRAVGRQGVGHRPVLDVLGGGLRRVVAGPDHRREGSFLRGSLPVPAERPHQTVPPGEIFASLTPRPLARLAFFDSRYLSAAICSESLCCSTLPESPLALAGPSALVLIELSRVSVTSLRLPCEAIHGRHRVICRRGPNSLQLRGVL